MATETWKTSGDSRGVFSEPLVCVRRSSVRGPATRIDLTCTLESAAAASSSSKTPAGTTMPCSRCFSKTASRCGEQPMDMSLCRCLMPSPCCTTESALSSPRSMTSRHGDRCSESDWKMLRERLLMSMYMNGASLLPARAESNDAPTPPPPPPALSVAASAKSRALGVRPSSTGLSVPTIMLSTESSLTRACSE